MLGIHALTRAIPTLPSGLKLLPLVACLTLAACGGGSGGGGGNAGGNPAPPPPPPPPPSSAEFISSARFLNQATFGPTLTEIEDVTFGSKSLWFRDQLDATPTLHLQRLLVDGILNDFDSPRAAVDSFWGAAIDGDDQLRQRMAYALSQILVISERGGDLGGRPLTVAHYMDILTSNAFGNYRDLLEEVTYSPAMANYLTYLYNAKADMNSGRVPDENYAREIMQLFTIGLVELNLDGTPRLGPGGQPIETYDNTDVTGLARVFTGLGLNGPNFWYQDLAIDAEYATLVPFDFWHSPEEKQFLSTLIPAGTDTETSIDAALDALFNHPNVAPFVSRQLIQRFTTSAPSPAYVQRVATTFENGGFTLPDGTRIGENRRGDLAATLAAILFDAEARVDDAPAAATYGKVREPVLRFTHWARAFGVRGADADREDWLWDTSSPGALGQNPYRSPSVFNFYRPGYVAPGTQTGAAGLTAPELQIVNEASVIGFANFLVHFITDSTTGDRRTETRGFHPDYSAEMALAGDVDELLDRLDLVFTYGALSDSSRDRIRTILESIPIDAASPAEGQRNRVQTAVLLIMTTPDYTVLR